MPSVKINYFSILWSNLPKTCFIHSEFREKSQPQTVLKKLCSLEPLKGNPALKWSLLFLWWPIGGDTTEEESKRKGGFCNFSFIHRLLWLHPLLQYSLRLNHKHAQQSPLSPERTLLWSELFTGFLTVTQHALYLQGEQQLLRYLRERGRVSLTRPLHQHTAQSFGWFPTRRELNVNRDKCC